MTKHKPRDSYRSIYRRAQYIAAPTTGRTMHPDIHVFKCRQDSIGVLLHDAQTGATAAIDAQEETAILSALKLRGWQLTDILVTHRHHDHVEAVPALKQRYGARVVAARNAGNAVPLVDVAVGEGDNINIGAIALNVLDTPGHCDDHISYWAPSHQALFCGDTIFKLGCGRMFEGDHVTFWASLQKLMALPDATTVYCGHDYVLSNARFSAAVLPSDMHIAKLLAIAEADATAGRLTALTTLGEEKATNLFLRAGDPAIAKAMGLPGASATDVFAALRTRKNTF
jgi:hydroxyacylglutathione hydrolase